MNVKSYLESIRELIGKDELAKAIESLSNLLRNSPKLDEMIIQSAKYNEVQKQIRQGVVVSDNANMTKNKIRLALLEIMEEIENQSDMIPKIQKELEAINENVFPTSNQSHYGVGDNIGRDKITKI